MKIDTRDGPVAWEKDLEQYPKNNFQRGSPPGMG